MDGKGSHQNSCELKTFVHREIEQLRGQRLVVDLSLCTGMDSTFMGTLTKIFRVLEKEGGTLHVIHAAGRNGELLRGVGLDALFTVDDSEEHLPATPAPDCAALPRTECSRAERAQICLESHEALVAADQRNAAKFRDVVELMRNECRPVLAH